jgi:hypothetical protein
MKNSRFFLKPRGYCLQRSILAALLGVACLMSGEGRGAITVKSEQLNPADQAWNFKTIPRPSKSDLANGAKVTLVGNRLETAAGEGAVLVNGVLPADSLDLSEEALLSNGNADGGRLVLDLGRAQAITAVASYSWHEWDVDQGSRAPQVYTLYGSAAENPDPNQLAGWKKIADVDTRPNQTGAKWNGQHGVLIADNAGALGNFRHLLFALQRTRSPLQTKPNLTGTLFAEIDVHSAATLARAGDAVVAKPAPIEHVWVVFKTHLDIGYTDRIEDVLKKYRVNMMDGALKVVEASRERPPEKRFSWTLAGWPLAHVVGPQQEPARRERIAQAVRAGEITFHALPYTTHTETQDLEDLVRGLGYASRLAREYGRPLPIGAKMTDVPCHSWIMPTLLAQAGAKFLQIGCNDNSGYVRVPPLFWWEGPDGSRILCNYTRVYGSGLVPPRDWPSKHYLAMTMTYDNQGPPSAAAVENLRQEAARKLPGVQVHFGTLDDFARAVLAENPELPVVRADMPDTWSHGWLSMPLEAKSARQFRALEPALDTLDTQLRAWGLAPAPLAAALAEAYAQSGLFSEHTFGPWGPKGGPWESGIPRRNLYGDEWKATYARGVYKKYEQGFDDKRAFAHQADEIVHRELAARLELLARSVKTEGNRIVVYNALPWVRTGVVRVETKEDHVYPLTDLATGKTVSGDRKGKELVFLATDVPANGYKAYAMPAASKWEPPPDVPGAPAAFDTPFYRIVFDLKRGGISSLVEKSSGRELVDKSSPYALGQFLHERFDYQHMFDFFKAYDRPGIPGQGAWVPFVKQDFPTNVTYAALTPTAWQLTVQHGPVAEVATLTAQETLGLAKGFALVFTCHRHQPSLEVEWHVSEKTPDPIPEGGWLCFPFAVTQPQFKLGRLGGPIDPLQDTVVGANRHYFCLNTGLTITDKDGEGIGLCPLDSPCVSLEEPGLWKYSLDFIPRRPAVFVNLYNNKWNTNFPEWQGGSWSSRVRLWPTGKGSGLAQNLIVPSWEARLPLLGAAAAGPGGQLPLSQSGLGLSRAGILITAFGQNPDGAGTVLRLWEQAGQSGECTVRLPAGMAATSLQPINLRGQPAGAPIRVQDGAFQATIKAYAPASFVIQ